MIIKKISKKDKEGKRLFVEITKGLKDNNYGLSMKAGDEVVIMSKRNLYDKELKKLVGKYIKYYLYDKDSFVKYEGILENNDDKYWNYMPKDIPDDYRIDYMIDIHAEKGEKKFVLLDKPYTLSEEEQGIMFFDELLYVYDLEVRELSDVNFKLTKCRKCNKEISIKDKFCKFCGKSNMKYSKES